MDSSKANSTRSPVSGTVVFKASAGKMRDFMGRGAALIAATLSSESPTATPDAPAGISGMGASRASGTGA